MRMDEKTMAELAAYQRVTYIFLATYSLRIQKTSEDIQ